MKFLHIGVYDSVLGGGVGDLLPDFVAGFLGDALVAIVLGLLERSNLGGVDRVVVRVSEIVRDHGRQDRSNQSAANPIRKHETEKSNHGLEDDRQNRRREYDDENRSRDTEEAYRPIDQLPPLGHQLDFFSSVSPATRPDWVTAPGAIFPVSEPWAFGSTY